MDALSQQPRIYTVSEITRNIKKTLEGKPDFNSIWIIGEISNLTFHSSGHIYFTLKDDDAVIAAVFFRYANKNITFKLKEGMSIRVFGNITVFEKRGSYQINVITAKPEGVGDLQRRIEELKLRLMREGIFDPRHKKKLPILPRRVGIVTSPTGAAVQDIIKVALRRFPNIEILIAPAVVQGDDAAVSIVRGIEELNKPEYGIDCIIAGRGGGSFEDLMPFNEEAVVRAFYSSRLPIVSAVGHQIDHPLSDDAADLAAPTPSAAAEYAVPVKKDFMDEIDYLLIRTNNAIASLIRDLSARIAAIVERRIFRDPYEIVSRREIGLSDLEKRIRACLREAIPTGRNRLLVVPDITILIKNIINNKTYRYGMALNALDQLSPLSVLKRGYSIAMDERDAVLKSVAGTAVGRLIKLIMHDGLLRCAVNSIEKGKHHGEKK
ncbi:MAG: exodeoxyribonuclease VII large subunit [Spirochaetes bacterium RBG_16_49_21]|nr:MAG: exodeoxyribonuclease VII large subunit [Spirochaetes bacterium RBG_16_49_21]